MSAGPWPDPVLLLRVEQMLEAWRARHGLWEPPDWLVKRQREGWKWPEGYTGLCDERGEMIFTASDENPVEP